MQQENDSLRRECAKLHKERELLRERLREMGDTEDILADSSAQLLVTPDPMTIGVADNSSQDSANTAMLNRMLDTLWPKISEQALEVLQFNLEAAVRNLSAPLNKLAFVKDQSFFGNRAPKFVDVRWGHQSMQMDGKETTNFAFRAKLEWDAQGGKSRISLRIAGAGLSICDIIIQGDLVVEFVGMMDTPPLFRGVRLFFLNLPEFDFDVQGSATMVSPASIKQTVLNVIETQISTQMVLPNRLGLKLAKDADIFQIIAPAPEGLLLLTVMGAENLRGLDTNLFSANTSDPFCQVIWAGQTYRTATQAANLSPSFDEFTVPLIIASSSHQKVALEIINENKYTQNSLLGRAIVPVVDMISWADAWGTTREETLKLANDRGKKSSSNGKIVLRAVWRPLLSKHAGKEERVDDRGVLSAGVYFASHVPSSQEKTQLWVSVHCSHLFENSDLGLRRTHKISHRDAADAAKADSEVMSKKMKVCNKYDMSEKDMASVLEVEPETIANCTTLSASREFHWNKNFDFAVQNLSKAMLTFRLMSKAQSAEEKELGNFNFNVKELIERCKWERDLVSVKIAQLARGICLKVRVQVHFLGKPKNEPPPPQVFGRCFEDLSERNKAGKPKSRKEKEKCEIEPVPKKPREKKRSDPSSPARVKKKRDSLLDALDDLAGDLVGDSVTSTPEKEKSRKVKSKSAKK